MPELIPLPLLAQSSFWSTLGDAVRHEPFRGAGVVAALVLIAFQLLLAPRGERRLIRGPILLLLVHLALVALAEVASNEGKHPLQYAGLFCLLVATGRSLFLLAFHSRLTGLFVPTLPKIVQEIIQGLIYALVLLITLSAAGIDPTSLVTGSALITAALGLAMKDTVGNIIAGLAIQTQRPFDVGDWIQFDEHPHHIGEVIEINWRATKVITLDKVEVVVPNDELARAPIRNFTKPHGYSRRSVFVTAPYEVPPQRVQKIILDALPGAFGVLAEPAPSVVTNQFSERGVEFWVRFFTTHFHQRDKVDGGVRDRIWYALQRHGIRIPGPLRHVELEHMGPETETLRDEIRHNERLEALGYVDFLRGLPPEAMDRLAAAAVRRCYSAGERIIRQGDEGSELFILFSGEVTVWHAHDGEPQEEIGRMGARDFFGEMACLTGERRTATVTATGDVELFVIDKSALAPILEASPRLAEHMSQILAARKAEVAGRKPRAALKADEDAADSRSILLEKIRKFFSLG